MDAGNNIGPEGAKAFAVALTPNAEGVFNTSLSTLNLQGNEIGAEATKCLEIALTLDEQGVFNRTLNMLNLSSCTSGEDLVVKTYQQEEDTATSATQVEVFFEQKAYPGPAQTVCRISALHGLHVTIHGMTLQVPTSAVEVDTDIRVTVYDVTEDESPLQLVLTCSKEDRVAETDMQHGVEQSQAGTMQNEGREQWQQRGRGPAGMEESREAEDKRNMHTIQKEFSVMEPATLAKLSDGAKRMPKNAILQPREGNTRV
ncbi:hypothetical protein CYMTET_46154 [Cymbomonas tetramitiformis]|uniref:Uncharacterized protein n=1 Tax=Cymbomonas tetramitiformis TaxID=36881 RepID=A0AAE0BWR3_9CHLO|nr:hypothetical protein CYMTET_46154 [Cymbomonas tetramitiformis]